MYASRTYFCICEADIYAIANVTVPLPYRMLAHSHSATSLYNLSQSAIMLHRVRHLTCERAWFLPRVIQVFILCLPFWHRFWLQKYLDFVLILELAVLFSRYSTCEIIPKCLSTWKYILMHLVCSQKRMFLFIHI